MYKEKRKKIASIKMKHKRKTLTLEMKKSLRKLKRIIKTTKEVGNANGVLTYVDKVGLRLTCNGESVIKYVDSLTILKLGEIPYARLIRNELMSSEEFNEIKMTDEGFLLEIFTFTRVLSTH